MRHLAVVFAELMFNVQLDVSCDDDLTVWSSVWEDIQVLLDKHRDVVDPITQLVQANAKREDHPHADWAQV
jgi:hypothetical protein